MNEHFPALFQPLQLGKIALRNRIIMAPMTRSRAQADGTPTDIMQTYYQQRASAGLIITEGVFPSEDGKGYCRTPGITNNEQQQAWKKIVQAVKSEGGSMIMQLMHCGRIANKANKLPTAKTVSASSIKAKGKMFTESGMLDFDQPIALSVSEIKQVIQEYVQAAERAFAIGFDGIELHAASGYLPAQFLSTGTNQRHDEYGGTTENRTRFVTELLTTLCKIDGADRIGIRICPGNPFNDLYDENPVETFSYLLDAINPMKLAYLHAIKSSVPTINVIDLAKKHFQGNFVLNDGFNAETANAAIAQHEADAISFGRHFIGNPDLVTRFERNLSLASFDPALLYTPGTKGYTDYA